MASYGCEVVDSGRYRLSFTVGGLLAEQGRTVAGLMMGDTAVAAAGDTLPHADRDDDAFVPAEMLESVRRYAVAENVLQIRTHAAGVRIVSEVVKRLSALTMGELRCIADADTLQSDRRALMWVAMCRYYALVGEFAQEVLHEHFLIGAPAITYDDYDHFMLGKAMWHPEIDDLSTSTSAKLRSNVFKAMVEAGLVNRSDDTIIPSLLSREVTGILMRRPESFGFFPMRGQISA
ncbi:DUF1819 family protein [uncultured Bifidobacterium sp.]|uniref:DUF1819 family protein n=1 Tax=uncultured Bifidobacterium sp. TaxID=165187 RepID=UPI00258D3A4E|nr:DUF1819 family protein [uncultured Bifidobacterium sp.]